MLRKQKRHSTREIATMLRQADELLAKGNLQSETARRLGISVMTLHRWRKNSNEDLVTGREDVIRRIDELTSENARLRRLLTDLYLAKMQIEESLKLDKKIRQ